MLPKLMYRRLDEIGIDFALLYPTYGLFATGMPGDELRRAMARALQPLLRGDVRRLPRPSRTGGRDPHRDPGRGRGRTRARRGRAGTQGRHPVRRGQPARARSRGRAGSVLAGHSRARFGLRLRPAVEALRRVGRLADVPRLDAGIRAARVAPQLCLQPHRQLRRGRRGGLPLAVLPRRPGAFPAAPLRLPRGWRRLGSQSVQRHPGPLGETPRGRDRALRPGPDRPRPARNAHPRVRAGLGRQACRSARRGAAAAFGPERGFVRDRRVSPTRA